MANITSTFNKLFDIKEDIEEEKSRFVNRINQSIFSRVDEHYKYGVIFRTLCYRLGENADDRIASVNRFGYGMSDNIPSIRSLSVDNFTQTLKILVLIYEFFSVNEYGYEEERNRISILVESALGNSNLDLGIEWKAGMFYPKGAAFLDEKLIEDSLEWISAFPSVREDYRKALSCLLKKNYPGVVDHCYLAIEGLARTILNNSKTLDNNKVELLKKLKFSQQWKSFLNNFTEYANTFKRHASENRKNINPQETEAFLYLTGLLIRLIASVT